MGLSAPKNRTKLSIDPNNTTWSRNTSRFGHRILISQGWSPGSYLGATDASHSSHYTAANASHIRVSLKDDNLGLGAKRGSKAIESFGLSGFEGVLGRLNGKTEEEVVGEERERESRALKVFTSRRWGVVTFVSGGFLVGEKIEKMAPVELVRRKKRKSDFPAAALEETGDEESVSNAGSKPEKKALKAERRALKEARRLKKAQRRAEKSSGAPSISTVMPSRENSTPPCISSEDVAGAQSNQGPPVSLLAALEPMATFVGGRHAVRQRYIRQKKMASTDPQALREIFMVKAQA
ncbi:hypothetical protein K432DRAFT_417415 [Lepidopterella palustris CBS 459.81]|uniref:PinX1-related protein 1 n=1 Tax=Lepidopterella palustris CBS 459.81 TaxID=1314670 RepID=A0A8E2JER8_9PEZI|nr:hypothetical protein K432DRAFT_417415 [Lepidopterella palustris CBS 459.81]